MKTACVIIPEEPKSITSWITAF